MSTLVFQDQRSLMGIFRQRPGFDTALLYRGLCDEEFTELSVAWDDFKALRSAETLTEVADGAIDLIVVAIGLLHGLGLDPQALWDEVHRSNVAKIKHPCARCHSTGIVPAPAEPGDYAEGRCPACNGQGYRYEARLREDGKGLKPEGWTPPDLLSIVKASAIAYDAGVIRQPLPGAE